MSISTRGFRTVVEALTFAEVFEFVLLVLVEVNDERSTVALTSSCDFARSICR